MALTLGVNSGFVTVAPTADPAETGTTIDGSSVVTKHTSPAGATKITSIGWYRASGTNAANWEIALYSEAAGVAATRLSVDATNSTTSNGWIVTTVDWAISENTAYWLGLQMDAHSGSSSVDGVASGGAGSDVLTSQTTLNDPYGGGAVADADAMYAIYALVNITHPTSGALTGPGSTVAGTAARTAAPVSHATTGILTGPGSTVAGTAARTRVHATTGVLTGSGSTVTGAAARFRAFDTAGILVGPGSVVSGSAVHQSLHTTSGALTGQGSTLSGSASRFRAHVTDGILVGAGSTVVGSADRSTITFHDTSGALVGVGAVLVGAALHSRVHQTTGVLTGAGSTLEGTSNHISLYPDPVYVLDGVVYGPGGIYTGTLPRGATGVVFDIATNNLIKVLTSNIVMTL